MVTARHGVAAPLPAFSASDNVALLPACSAEGTASLAGTGTYPCVSLEDPAGKDIIGHAPTNDGSQHVCTVCHDTFDDRSNCEDLDTPFPASPLYLARVGANVGSLARASPRSTSLPRRPPALHEAHG